MVVGLDKFKSHFENYKDQYMLIGGTACSVVMNEAGLTFRATQDLDIVLHVEALDVDFAKAFWDFIREGKYSNRQKSTGKRIYYRFDNPEDKDFPKTLELFARSTDILDIPENAHLTPIPIAEGISSLSAIILDNDYYNFIISGVHELNGLSIVKPEHLVVLKAKAWLNLRNEQEAGLQVDSNNIRKHKNDVFRLYQVISPDASIRLTASIAKDMRSFLDQIEKDTSLNLASLGLKNTNIKEIIGSLASVYLFE